MKLLFKPTAIVLSLAVTLVCGWQKSSVASLAPAHLSSGAQVLDPTADMKTIQQALESKALRGRLHAMGLSDAEIETRLAKLSTEERHQLASQIRAVNPAGDAVIWVLVVVVLVLLIIYLFKRV